VSSRFATLLAEAFPALRKLVFDAGRFDGAVVFAYPRRDLVTREESERWWRLAAEERRAGAARGASAELESKNEALGLRP
jgi:hypothetical protein